MAISGSPTGRRTATLASLALGVGGLTWLAAPAAMALDAPGGLTQDSSTAAGPGIPVLRWDGVLGASSYEVKIGTASAVSTTNTRYVPTSAVASTTTQFQVRAKTGSTYSEWTVGSFVTAEGNGPELLTPADGATLQQPADAPLLTWAPVNGALEYEVRYSQNPAFTDQIVTQTAKSPQILLAKSLVAQRYYWQVRARIGTGIHTAWSADPAGSSTPRWFEVAPLSTAQRVAPATDNTIQTDVVFDWDPIPGAVTYDLQVSPNENFANTSSLTQVTGLASTRYSPPKTLTNDQYYWRVRAKDASGNVQDWSVPTIWRFQRDWTEQPSLTYPAQDATVGNPFYYQWTPVKWASSYQIDLSSNANFTESTTSSCTTFNTTFTPFAGTNACRPAATGTYYWRVVATDNPASGSSGITTDVIGATVGRFSYYPDLVEYASPADGESVAVPTLSWEPVAGAATYTVKVTGLSPRATGSHTTETAALSYTPTNLTTDCSALPGELPFEACQYRWDVVWKNEAGNSGSARNELFQRTFWTAASAPPTQQITLHPTIPGQRVPALSWSPLAGAERYRVFAKSISALDAHAGTQIDTATTEQTAYTPRKADFLPPDTYRWRVEALNDAGIAIYSTGFDETFTVNPLPAATNKRVGLTGSAVTYETAIGATCSLANCQNIRSTPVLRWDPYPNAGYYELYLSRNKEFTNLVGSARKVFGTMYAFTEQLQDMQAGSAYYWHVRPCTSSGVCALQEYAQHDFNQLSNPVERIGTGVACTVPGTPSPTVEADDLTFCWKDFLETNATVGQGSSELTTPGQSEAKAYQIQTSSVPTFATTLDSAEVDQTTFTPTKAYPEGTVYWRVRGKDGQGNYLTWSSVGTLLKQSPVPQLTEPASAAEVAGDVTLRWAPLPYAATYTLEIYKNGDTTAQTANRTVSAVGNVHAAWTGTTPLAPGTYAWRVRRVDASTNPGGWSTMRTFTVTGTTSTAIAPTNGLEVLRNGALFTWTPVKGAASYTLERRAAGTATVSTMLSTTNATLWAPTATLADGSWQWRVLAKDLNSQVLGTSDWADYTVNGKLAATQPPRIEGSGAVATQLTAFAPEWNHPDVTEAYQWYRGSSAIAGATGTTYLVTSADYNKQLTVRVTGTHLDYASTTTTSNAIGGSIAPPVVETDRPLIDGSGEVGTDLVLVQEPTWMLPGVKASYAWLAGEKVLRSDGGTFKPLTVTTSRVGTPITLRVTGTLTGYGNSVLLSNEIMPIPADTIKPTAPVAITGTHTLGSRLRASGPTWDQSRVTTTYQWRRNGVAIPGATASSYTVTPADLTKKLTLKVIGTKQGYHNGSSTSKALTVPKVISTAKLTVSASSLKVKKKLTLTASISGPGLNRVTGKVKFMDGTKVLKTLTLNAKSTAVFSTRALKKGTHKLRVVYVGTTMVKTSKSPVVKVVVTR